MTGRRRAGGVAAAAVLAGLAAAGVAAWRRPSDATGLDGVPALLAARRFDDVERRLAAFLRHDPSHPQANLLMAQVAMDRDDPKPRLALDHLGRVRTADRKAAAVARLYEGKAYSELGRYDRAEASWREALRLDPLVPEAGWALLGLYYVEGRRAEARSLGLELHAREPDPRDRAQLLLELTRQDAQPVSSESLIKTLGPVVARHPEDLHPPAALGLAYVRASRPDRGLTILRGLVERSPDEPAAWDALCRGLEDASRTDELAEALRALPPALAGDPRFARYRGVVAQQRRDWAGAADALARARAFDPSDAQVLYRLARVLRAAGRGEEAARLDPVVRAAESAAKEALALYEEADGVKTLGTSPHPDLYRRLAGLRERMGLPDEALAWHRMVLRDRPDDPESLNAVARLSAEAAR